MTAPAVVQVSSVLTVTTGTTGNITFTNPVTAGNAIILEIIQTASGSRTYSCSDGTNTYAVAIRAEHSTNVRVAAVLHAFNIAGGTPTIAPLASASTTFRAIAYEISGLPVSPTVVTSSFEDGSSVTSHHSAASGSIDTTIDSAIFACGVASGTLSTITAASGFTQNASGGNGIFQYQMTSAASTDERATWTSVTARDCISVIVAYQTAVTSVDVTVTLPADWLVGIEASNTIPSDWLVGAERELTLPADWLVTVDNDVSVPADWLVEVETSSTIPVDWLLGVEAASTLPADWLGGVSLTVVLPVDWISDQVDIAIACWTGEFRDSVWLAVPRGNVFEGPGSETVWMAIPGR